MRVLLGLFAFGSLTSIAFASDCAFDRPPSILEVRSNYLLQQWELPNADILDTTSRPLSPELDHYGNTIRSRIPDLEPFALLDRYLALRPDAREARIIERVRSRALGRIRPIGCIESLLLDHQLRRTPAMLTAPTEFLAFFLQHEDSRLRIYYQTNDQLGVRELRQLIDRVREDASSGWKVLANLHNHSFFLDHLHPGDRFHPQGVLAPSANDAQALASHAAELRMPLAWITNGFDTLEVDTSELVE